MTSLVYSGLSAVAICAIGAAVGAETWVIWLACLLNGAAWGLR